MEPDLADGRRRRRAQNREAVIDALLSLFGDGNYQPGMAEIAARDGEHSAVVWKPV